jgi:hypothetical protein
MFTLFSVRAAEPDESADRGENMIDSLDATVMDNAVAIMKLSQLPYIEAAEAQFDSLTGCKLRIESYLKKGKEMKDPLRLLTTVENIFRQAAKSNAINVSIAWEATDKGYDIRTYASVNAEDMFSYEALKAFTDSLNDRHSETLSTIVEPKKTHERIITALGMLQQKHIDLTKLLQTRIVAKLSTSTERFQQYAYQNQNELSNIVVFDKSYSGGGKYVNKQLIIGTDQKINNSNENILSTIYHEYMHYINDKYKIFPYRMENAEEGIVYTKIIPQYERRMETQEEFLHDAYDAYMISLWGIPDAITHAYALSLPSFYQSLTESQTLSFEAFIKEKKLKPEIKYFTYRYLPSNYYVDEINAHQETLKANSVPVFAMGTIKIQFYHSEIGRYNDLRVQAQEYESNNNVNPTGYDK